MLVVPFYIKLALGFLVAGLIVLVIGVATPYWVNYYGWNRGLFQYCVDRHGCYSGTSESSIEAARVFEVIALILAVIVIILLVVYLNNLRRDIHLAALICTFVDVGLIIIGIICFVAYTTHNLSWSFVLTVIAAILIFIAGIFLVVHRTRGVVVTHGVGGTTRTTRTVTTTVTVR